MSFITISDPTGIIGAFSDDYLIRIKRRMGRAINFDGANSGPVREVSHHKWGYWIEGISLRWVRSTQHTHPRSIQWNTSSASVGRAARESTGSRSIILIAENRSPASEMARPLSKRGARFGRNVEWDDFHHSAVVSV